MTARLIVRRDAGLIRELGGLTCVGTSGDPIRFEAASAELARAALDHLRSPQTLDSLRLALEGDAGQPIDRALVAALVDALRNASVIGAVEAPPSNPAGSLAGVRVVLALTGAIATADAPRLVLALQARGATVRVALTRSARRFVARRALTALTHAPAPWRMTSDDPTEPAPHIALAQWADVVVVAPASATTLSRIATGDCSDLVSALSIATQAPIIVAPSMNQAMWLAPSTRRNVAALARDGHAIIEPQYGVEVADRPGQRVPHVGSMLRPDRLVHALEVWLRQRAPELFRPAVDWDAAYATPSALSWLSDGLDDDVAAALHEHAAPPGRLLDLGCGVGAQARAAAALGYSVVGVDASEAALLLASEGPPTAAVLVKDDLLTLGLRSTFDVLLDRGTLHTLRAAEIERYAAVLARLSHAGTLLIVVHDGATANTGVATLRFTSEELAQRLPAFELVAARATTLRTNEPGCAQLSLFRRRL